MQKEIYKHSTQHIIPENVTDDGWSDSVAELVRVTRSGCGSASASVGVVDAEVLAPRTASAPIHIIANPVNNR